MPAAIVCQHSQKRYAAKPVSVEAFNGLELEVERRECFGLLGPNGAGKTPTIHLAENFSRREDCGSNIIDSQASIERCK